jgi:oxygen-independent coproporphyrinogen-3 oxidase
MPERPTDRGAGLYVHVPFCARKCPYCDFYSIPAGATDAGAGEAIERYLDALAIETSRWPPGFSPATVFLGGGTPTALPEAALGRLLDVVRSRIRPEAVAEWTCEANPGTLTPAKARLLRGEGVNRLSIGVQGLDPSILVRLGRLHDAREAREAVGVARAAGFENVGLDLMYAVPGLTPAVWAATLDAVVRLAPDHVSAYALTIEDGTPLARERAAGRWPEEDEDEAGEQYAGLRRALAAAGFEHYEISNWARPGRACRHNLLYWSGGDYAGAGPSAHAHAGGRRRANLRDLRAWADALRRGADPIEFEETLDPEARARETLVFGLRRIAGVDREWFRGRTGFDYEALRGREIDALAAEGLLERTARGVRLTERALFVSDRVFAELV